MRQISTIDKLSGTILSCLKLRTINREVENLSKFFEGRDVYVYEQDPWECFGDEAFCPGSYQRIYEKLQIKSFLTPTKWWSDHINSVGIPSKFVKMWMLPEYCSENLSYSDRKIEVGHMGQLHPWRKTGLENLSKLGLSVDIVKTTTDYRTYLKTLGTMKTFLHDESPHFAIGGKIVPCNAMWGKEVEVMSQGTFCLRNREDESVFYGLRSNPLLLEFSSYEEIVHLVNEQSKKSNEELNELRRVGVEMIRSDEGWKTIPQAIE